MIALSFFAPGNLAATLVITMFAVATWNEENVWKRWFITLVAVAALIVNGVANFAEGYEKGSDATKCAFATQMDASPKIDIGNMEDYCS